MRLWLLPVALAAVGCPSATPRSDDPEPTSAIDAALRVAATAAAATAPVAKNAARVAHYPAEKTLDYVLITIRSARALVSTGAGVGESVAILRAGEPVMLVGHYESFLEILFNNPSDPSTKLGGWVADTVFDDPAATTKARSKAAAGPLPSVREGAAPSKCGPYQLYDEATKKCLSFTCPSGYSWSEPMQACLMSASD